MKVETKPISVNHAYAQSRQGRRFLTKEGKAYKEMIGWAAEKDSISDPCYMRYTFGFKDKRRRDVDDYVKLAQDALSGIWYNDDSQIMGIYADKVIGKEEFVEIERFLSLQELINSIKR